KNGSIEIVNFLGAQELSRQIAASKLVICRSGYSSIMDLIYLNKKAILIPTPGQPEQEYLAQYHINNPLFKVVEQDDLNIMYLLVELEKEAHTYQYQVNQTNHLDKVIHSTLLLQNR
ncbi:MAG: glycosyltransferase, partial [Bacteroidota bacterium]